MTPTIYEIIEDFVLAWFPSGIQTTYADVLELMIFTLTTLFYMTFILIPLWRIAMLIMPKRGR